MSQNVTKDTTQYIKNKSFDSTYQTSQVEAVGYDSAGGVLRPIATDANGQIKLASIASALTFTEISTPSTPSANDGKLYFKDVDGESQPFALSDAGIEYSLTLVPYTGATADVDLGSYKIITMGVKSKNDIILTSGRKLIFDGS